MGVLAKQDDPFYKAFMPNKTFDAVSDLARDLPICLR